jgi:hypothetical protein
MQSLKVSIFENSTEASAAGYSYVAPVKPAVLQEAVIVRNGTKGGNATVDLVFTDMQGNKYVAMVTANLLKSLPL